MSVVDRPQSWWTEPEPVEQEQDDLTTASPSPRASRGETWPTAVDVALTAAASLTVSALVLFGLSALLGVVVAYDPVVAFDKFALLGLGLFAALALSVLNRAVPHDQLVGWACVTAGWLAGGLAALFLLTHDWRAEAAVKFTLLHQLGLAIQSVRPALPLHELVHANVAAAALLVLTPLGAAGLVWLWRQQPGWSTRLVALVTGGMVALALSTLGLTGSRGAFFGLAVSFVVTAYLYWRSGPGHDSIARWAGDLVGLLLLGGLVGSVGLAMFTTTAGPLGALSVGGSAMSRAALWRDSLALVADYRFTGSGLGMTSMVYSTYLFLLHVPFLSHAHNLLLQIALEQGLPGLITFVWMTAGTLWSLWLVLRHGRPAGRLLATGAVAAMVAMQVHGLVEAGLYASRLVFLLPVPYGVAWALRDHLHLAVRRVHTASRRVADERMTARLVALSLPILAVVALFLWPGSRAAFQTNLAAADQTRQELGIYAWPAWPIQDELRRSGALNLVMANQRYGAALFYDANNVSAHRRVGQIALSLGELATAQEHLEAANRLEPGQRATRQLLGELYAVQGRTPDAVALWKTVDNGAGQLQLRRWWWEQHGTAAQLAGFDAALCLLNGSCP